MKSKYILIKGGTMVSFNNDQLVQGEFDILIKNDRILEINKCIVPSVECNIIDAHRKIVLPGFVDTHRHLWESPFKGMASNWTLMEYLNNMLGEIAPTLSAEDVYIANLLGAIEAINSGITTVFDWSHIMNTPEHTEAAIKGLKDSKIRAKFGYGTPGTSVWEWFYESQLRHPLKAKDLRKNHFNSSNNLVTMALAIRGPEYSSMEATKHDILLGRELDLQISMHIGGGTFGPKYNGIKKLYAENLLGNDLNFAHANTISKNDFKLLADHGSSISVTPEVELQMGLGLPVTGKALKFGIPVGLGVDVVCATSGSMFDQMKAALQTERAIQNEFLYQKSQMPETLAVKDMEVLKMATIGGAKVLGLDDKIGSLEVGKQADIIIISPNTISTLPFENHVSMLVLYAKDHDVDTVMVAGNILKKDGKLVREDIGGLLKGAHEMKERFVANR
ncbi:amidohydrolase family protein [Mariniflexile gromovii]|uniref:Amidohydrolase family protein n=1 Tax=Mariniflexile gromovii TaxID=362523 RepID=A0ABS4BTZ4_9FLAO|nr:amidohydrolase family protein [Mariniflexile gromovii]MBP0904069.1 amidohydrolase family protein [Mariniflexile gromovii]